MELIRTTGGGSTVAETKAKNMSDAYWGIIVPFALLILVKCGQKGVERCGARERERKGRAVQTRVGSSFSPPTTTPTNAQVPQRAALQSLAA